MNWKMFFNILILMIFPVLVSANSRPVVVVSTNYGNIEIELYKDKAPVTVKNFMKYVDSGFYKKTIFHRVIDGFMIQGGGYTENMQRKSTFSGIKNEASNGISNEVGTIAMARTANVDSATSQFFINVNDNSFLDHKNSSKSGYGYAVFGRVKRGMSIINKIKMVKTIRLGAHANVPNEPVIINKIVKK